MQLDRRQLIDHYQEVRALTERLAEPLSPEDQLLQSMPSCSPTKWHRAHTTWFFEAFVLRRLGVPPVDAHNDFLWNSYYEAVGARHPRPQRGLLSRPSLAEVAAYRRAVDGRMLEALATLDARALVDIVPIVRLGLAHEQQHQELVLTDILHALSLSPLRPAYRAPVAAAPSAPVALSFVPFEGGLVEIGAARGAHDFAFDNEEPRHRVWLEPFALANRLLTVGEVRAFIEAGGYTTPSLWLSEGWDWVRRERIEAPLHARLVDGAYRVFTLEGERDADDAEPAAHLSYFEADAIARFVGARLPSEAEWEHAMGAGPVAGHFLELARPLRPLPAEASDGAMTQRYGDAWVWTRSAYAPYPGYAPSAGALGEYNGKFMVNQMVLRGGSCFSPPGHLRASYRNFWYPDTRFNLNLLARINGALGGHFALERFRHVALWNDEASQIEMHLESVGAQSVRVDALGRSYQFADGERIHTESSVKYDLARVDRLLAASGFVRERTFEDDDRLFAVHLARVRGPTPA